MGECVLVKKIALNTGTYTASSRGASLDMGQFNTYRYVNTNNVPNSNSTTYTFPSGDTGGTKDLGSTNTYRYVNAQNVYSAGYNNGVSAGSSSTYTWIGSQICNQYGQPGNNGTISWTATQPCYVHMDYSYEPEGQYPTINGSKAPYYDAFKGYLGFVWGGTVCVNKAHANWGIHIYAWAAVKV